MNRLLIATAVLALSGCVTTPKPLQGEFAAIGPREAVQQDLAGERVRSRVVKGGSYLCAPNYCQRYRPESRQGRDPGLGASNVGFRLVYDSPPGT